eukprot:7831548-Ditylum_brightwellii.AAC.1
MALTALLAKCQQLICGEQPGSDLCPLLHVFLMPFTSEGTGPPSGPGDTYTRIFLEISMNISIFNPVQVV